MVKDFYDKICITCGEKVRIITSGYMKRNNIIPKRDICDKCSHIETEKMLKKVARDFIL